MGGFSCVRIKGFTFNGAGGMAKKENWQLDCRAPQFFLLKILRRKEVRSRGRLPGKVETQSYSHQNSCESGFQVSCWEITLLTGSVSMVA